METILDSEKLRSGCHPSRKPGFCYSFSCAEHKSLLLRTICPLVPEGSAGCSVKNGFLAPEAAQLKHLAGVPEMCAPALRQHQAQALWSLSMGLWPVQGASSCQTLGPDTVFSCGPPATEATVLQLPVGPASTLSNTVMLSIKEQKFVKSLWHWVSRSTKNTHRALPKILKCGYSSRWLLPWNPSPTVIRVLFMQKNSRNELLVSYSLFLSVLETASCMMSHLLHTQLNQTCVQEIHLITLQYEPCMLTYKAKSYIVFSLV